MGSFTCKCGHLTDDGPQYDKVAGVHLSSQQCRDLEAIVGRKGVALKDSEDLEDLVAAEMNERFRPYFCCPKCKRMYVGSGTANQWDCYKPDGQL